MSTDDQREPLTITQAPRLRPPLPERQREIPALQTPLELPEPFSEDYWQLTALDKFQLTIEQAKLFASIMAAITPFLVIIVRGLLMKDWKVIVGGILLSIGTTFLNQEILPDLTWLWDLFIAVGGWFGGMAVGQRREAKKHEGL